MNDQNRYRDRADEKGKAHEVGMDYALSHGAWIARKLTTVL